MNAGELRHRVTFQKRGIDPATGGLTGWVDYVTVWAKVEDLSGRDYFAGRNAFQGQVLGEASQITTRITIRWRSGIKPHMRAVLGDRKFDVVSVLDPDGCKRSLQLMCTELG